MSTKLQSRKSATTSPNTKSRPAATRRSAFFRWTIKRGWRDADPTEHIDKTREIDEAVSILTVSQVQKLLAVCAADPECRLLLAATAIGLFAGLRTSELASLGRSSDRQPAIH